jgi:flagellar L-ring protein precursor FlgH
MIRYLLALLLCVCAGLPAQSLWNPNRPAPSLIADTTARNIGDVLSVIVSEKQTVRNKEQTDFSKGSSIDAALSNWDIFENMFGILPALSGNQERTLQGDVKYDKDGTLQARLAVLVIDVMPNGNMVVEGRRRIVMDKETKTIRFTGIVRPFDVTPLNTVKSENVANASIAYEGDGPFTVATNRGWLSELLDFVWPF